MLQYMSLAGNMLSFIYLNAMVGHPFAFLDMSNNRLDGILPSNLWNTSIAELLLNNNLFWGTFPTRGDRDCSLQYLSIAGNRLLGSLPRDLQLCMQLTNFLASDMQLTGVVNGLFSTQPRLQVVVLSNNSFTGPIDDIFTASMASGFILNAAYNQYTGTLPVRSLRTGQYQSLILTSNCFTGTLPGDALCMNTNMTELILSGLHSAISCRLEVFPTLSGLGLYMSYVEMGSIRGGIPACVFHHFPQLTYLALSGNALTGSLPRVITLPKTLQGLDLSHNLLTGSIATGIVAANLSLLDLSFNRLSGTISNDASDIYSRNPQAKVSLEVNGLSGTLPVTWVDAFNINVLNGNLFACAANQIAETANRPKNDPAQATYACGSSSTNIALLTAALVCVVLAIVYDRTKAMVDQSSLSRWILSIVSDWKTSVLVWYRELSVLTMYLLGCLVLYVILTVTTTAYSETYVWMVSLALQQGEIAGWLVLVWFAVLVGGSVWRWQRVKETLEVSRDVPTVAKVTTSTVLIGALHMLPVFVINMVYVYTTTLPLPGSVQAAVVMGMTVVKVSWNSLMSMYLSNDTSRFGQMLSDAFHGTLHARQLLLCFGLINLIVSPVVTEALVSPNCFRYLFTEIPTNSYSIAGGTCYWIAYDDIVNGTTQQKQATPCMSYAGLQETYDNNVTTSDMAIISTTSNGEASTVDFQAGFAYNYQCSFSLLQAFVFVFIYKYLLTIFVMPLVWLTIKRWQGYAYNQCGLSSLWYRMATTTLPPMMRLVLDDDVDVSDVSDVDAARDVDDRRVDTMAIESNLAQLTRWEKSKQIQKCGMWLSLRISGDLAVALSFGVLFPLLGLLALVEVMSDVLQTTWMLHRLRRHTQRMGRRVQQSVAAARACATTTIDHSLSKEGSTMVEALQCEEYHRLLLKYIAGLEAMIPTSLEVVPKDLWTVLCFAAVTWSLSLYDIIGRTEGPVISLWILIVTLSMPWWVRAIWMASRWWVGRSYPSGIIESKGSTDTDTDPDLEMTENPLRDRVSTMKTIVVE